MKTEKTGNAAQADASAASVSMMQVFGSIAAAFYGVQSSKNRERDFKSGKAKHFIAAGLIMTLVWYSTIYLIVNVVLSNAR